MGKVILDDDLRAKLNGLNEAIEFCEPTGETIGHFIPEDQYLKFLYTLARHAVSKEELDAAAQEQGGRKLTDIRRDRLGGP